VLTQTQIAGAVGPNEAHYADLIACVRVCVRECVMCVRYDVCACVGGVSGVCGPLTAVHLTLQSIIYFRQTTALLSPD
jgi:hypothetical protein